MELRDLAAESSLSGFHNPCNQRFLGFFRNLLLVFTLGKVLVYPFNSNKPDI